MTLARAGWSSPMRNLSASQTGIDGYRFGTGHSPVSSLHPSCALSLLLVLGVQQGLLEAGDVVVQMRVADDPVDLSSNVSGSDIADDGGTGSNSESGRVGTQPVM